MHPLLRLVVVRVLALAPMLLALSIASFALVHVIPGDPALVMMGGEGTTQGVEELRRQLGLDRPLHIRYLEWLGKIVRGDLGESLYNKTRVSEELLWRMPTTLALVTLALLFSIGIGVPAGLLSASFRNSWIDHVARLLTLVSLSLPSFWLGLMLIILFSLWLDLLPIVGYEPITRGLWRAIPFLILPSLSLGTYLAALLTRLTRSSMLEVLNQDYVRTARAKGLGNRVVLMRHALRNALIPIVTVIGINVGILLGGSAVIETVFVLPGVGPARRALALQPRPPGHPGTHPLRRGHLRAREPAGRRHLHVPGPAAPAELTPVTVPDDLAPVDRDDRRRPPGRRDRCSRRAAGGRGDRRRRASGAPPGRGAGARTPSHAVAVGTGGPVDAPEPAVRGRRRHRARAGDDGAPGPPLAPPEPGSHERAEAVLAAGRGLLVRDGSSGA